MCIRDRTGVVNGRSSWWRWKPPACTGSRSTTPWRTASGCGCATHTTSRMCRGVRPTCPMLTGWLTWPHTGRCGKMPGIKLTSVASKVLTQSGRAMIQALIEGEGDPGALAELAKGKLRPKIPELTAALSGHFGAHHALVADRVLAHLDFLDDTIAQLSRQIAERVAEGYQPVLDLLLPIPGLQHTSVEVIIAETGADMSCFPTPGQLASWAGLCPGNHESAGKRRKVGTTAGNQWLRRTLIESARAAARTKGSYFGAQYHQIARRRGPNKAAVAVAHSLLDVIWHALSTGEVFTDPGADYFTTRQDPEHRTRRLVNQLERLGYTVELTQTA